MQSFSRAVGIDALQIGHLEIAKKCFDNALNYIEAVFADNEKAKKARSLWYEEGMKDFKGEPYERVMAYYYRGLLYLIDKDYENARACFKAGIIQDAFAEENQNRCDFALLLFLEAYSCLKLGDHQLATAAFDRTSLFPPTILIS
jgi:tetratricopeptide (TPR) repeat protein